MTTTATPTTRSRERHVGMSHYSQLSISFDIIFQVNFFFSLLAGCQRTFKIFISATTYSSIRDSQIDYINKTSLRKIMLMFVPITHTYLGLEQEHQAIVLHPTIARPVLASFASRTCTSCQWPKGTFARGIRK